MGGRDPKRPPPPTLSILWAARLTVHTRSILSPRPAPLPGSPSAGLHVREQEWGAALRLLRDQDRGGQRVSPQCTHPGPSFKASGDRGSPSLAPTARLSPSHCQTVAPHTVRGEVGCRGRARFRSPEPLAGGGGARGRAAPHGHSLLSPTPPCAATSDPAAGEWAPPGGRQAREGQWAGPLPALTPRPFSTKDTSRRPPSSQTPVGTSLSTVAGTSKDSGCAGTHAPWEQQQLRLPGPARPGKQVAGPPLPLRTHRAALRTSPAW